MEDLNLFFSKIEERLCDAVKFEVSRKHTKIAKALGLLIDEDEDEDED